MVFHMIFQKCGDEIIIMIIFLKTNIINKDLSDCIDHEYWMYHRVLPPALIKPTTVNHTYLKTTNHDHLMILIIPQPTKSNILRPGEMKMRVYES